VTRTRLKKKCVCRVSLNIMKTHKNGGEREVPFMISKSLKILKNDSRPYKFWMLLLVSLFLRICACRYIVNPIKILKGFEKIDGEQRCISVSLKHQPITAKNIVVASGSTIKGTQIINTYVCSTPYMCRVVLARMFGGMGSKFAIFLVIFIDLF